MASDILIIDDDAGFAAAAADFARLEGYTPRLAHSVAEAREQLRRESDLLLIDLQLPDGSGLDLLHELDPLRHGRIAIVTGHPTVETATRAVSSLAHDYLLKPLDPEAYTRLLRDSKRPIHVPVSPSHEPIPGVVAASASMSEPVRLARAFAASGASMLLTGEPGTGKDLFAHAIHRMSGCAGAFVRLDCGAQPHERLFDLLADDRGDALAASPFHAAKGGTLYLDEVDTLPQSLQGALLRRIENLDACTLESAGRDMQVRLISSIATSAAARPQQLRDELYYRLADVHLSLPPLRHREEDVVLLTRRFLIALNRRYDLDKRLAPHGSRALRAHGWPGNVRELQHVLHRSYLAADGVEVFVSAESRRAPPPVESDHTLAFSLGTPMAEIERRMLAKALEHSGNDKTAAAKLLGISVRTVHNHLAKMKAQGNG